MPSYEDQLAMYRQQLAQAATPLAPSPAATPSYGQVASLAFNTLREDLSNLANMVRASTITPHVSNIAPSPTYIQPGAIASAASFAGIYSPPVGVNAAEYQMAARGYVADAVGDATRRTSMTLGGLAAGMGASVLEYGAWEAGLGLLGFGTSGAAMLSGATTGAAAGAGLLGGAGTAIAGSTIGGTAGTIIGGGIGAAAGALAPIVPPALALAGAVAFGSEMAASAEARGQTRDYLQQTSWRYMGDRGFNRNQRQDISRALALEAASDRDFGFEEIQGILQTGTQLGMFNGTQNVEDFKRKFKELKEGLKTVADTMKVSLDEGMQLMSEIKQGGFYTAASQGAAAMVGKGLGYGAGISATEMHEMGMRGAAMFRGTGISTRLGYEMSQQNLAAVTQMQQGGMVNPEVINQMGGRVGAATQMTQLTAQLMQSERGRAIGALLIGGPGGELNEEAARRLMAGERITDVMRDIRPDYRNLNAVNMQRVYRELGSQRTQAILGSSIGSQARDLMRSTPGLTEENAFYQITRGMNLDPARSEMLYKMYQNAPKILAKQASDIERQMALNVRSEYNRRNTYWERFGGGAAQRWVEGAAASAAEPFVQAGQIASEVVEDTGLWLEGMERYEELPPDRLLLSEAAMLGSAGSKDVAFTISKRSRDRLRAATGGRGIATTARSDISGKYVYGFKPGLASGAWSGEAFLREDVDKVQLEASYFRQAASKRYTGAFWKTEEGTRAIGVARDILSEKFQGERLGDLVTSEDMSRGATAFMAKRLREVSKARGVSGAASAAALRRTGLFSDEAWTQAQEGIVAVAETIAPMTKSEIWDDMSGLVKEMQDVTGEEIVDYKWYNPDRADELAYAMKLKEYFEKGGHEQLIAMLQDPNANTGKVVDDMVSSRFTKKEAGRFIRGARKFVTQYDVEHGKGAGLKFISGQMIGIRGQLGQKAIEQAREEFAKGEGGLASSLAGGKSFVEMASIISTSIEDDISAIDDKYEGAIRRVKAVTDIGKRKEFLGADIRSEKVQKDLQKALEAKGISVNDTVMKVIKRSESVDVALERVGGGLLAASLAAKEKKEGTRPSAPSDRAREAEIAAKMVIEKGQVIESLRSVYRTLDAVEQRMRKVEARK